MDLIILRVAGYLAMALYWGYMAGSNQFAPRHMRFMISIMMATQAIVAGSIAIDQDLFQSARATSTPVAVLGLIMVLVEFYRLLKVHRG